MPSGVEWVWGSWGRAASQMVSPVLLVLVLLLHRWYQRHLVLPVLVPFEGFVTEIELNLGFSLLSFTTFVMFVSRFTILNIAFVRLLFSWIIQGCVLEKKLFPLVLVVFLEGLNWMYVLSLS